MLCGNHDSACVGLESGLEVLFNENYDLDREQREESPAVLYSGRL